MKPSDISASILKALETNTNLPDSESEISTPQSGTTNSAGALSTLSNSEISFLKVLIGLNMQRALEA